MKNICVCMGFLQAQHISFALKSSVNSTTQNPLMILLIILGSVRFCLAKSFEWSSFQIDQALDHFRVFMLRIIVL